MKKAVCISCTHHYGERTQYIQACLQKLGYECIYITSDFSHIRKEKYRVDVPNCIQIPTKPYRKNLSVSRILSHIRFAKDALAAVTQIAPEVLYVEVPPNSLCREAAKYKRRHPQVKLILDIFDLWPEGFPNSRAKKLLTLPFGIWGWFRNSGLPAADLVMTECDLFRRRLGKRLHGARSQTIPLCRPEATAKEVPAQLPQDAVHLCYLGSINHIIDIPCIAELIGKVQAQKNTVLHIIGDGETREKLISQVAAVGAQVVYHGKVYDTAEKQKIFDRCHFGINIMKESVCVGLTMKSLDYFAAGLPIINSIEADTWELVERERIGVNICREDLKQTATAILACSAKQTQMRQRVVEVFHRVFTQETFEKSFVNALTQTGGSFDESRRP